MSRAKGNRFEREVARRFVEADGLDPEIAVIASSTGRVGHLDLGADVVSRRFAIEVKHRDAISLLPWRWLDHISFPNRIRLLVVKRDRLRPLVMLDLDDFLTLIDQREDA